MRNRPRSVLLVIVAAAVMGVLAMAVAPAAAQDASYNAPRLVGADNPDLNGIWQALNTAHWDIRPHAAGSSAFPELLGAIGAVPAGHGVIEGNEIPYQPWAAEKQREHFDERFTRPSDLLTNETAGDPEAKCYLPGVPRATYMPFPFQIFHTPGLILISYEYASATRQIHLDRQPPSPNVSWMGWSIGRWEGDTLVVETRNFMDLGTAHPAPNMERLEALGRQLHLVERFSRLDADTLVYRFAINDPTAFTKPWSVEMTMTKTEDTLYEYACHEGNYGLYNILAGAQAAERAANAVKPSSR